MLEIINSIVLVMFGILLGVLLKVTMAYEPIEEEKMKELKQREGESFLQYLGRKTSREYQEKEKKIRESMPKPYQRALFGTGVLVIMLIIVLIITPIHMNWLIFIGSIIGGVIIYELIFYLAKAGKIKVSGESFFDIPPSGKPLRQRKSQ